jgi:hypothetical protein
MKINEEKRLQEIFSSILAEKLDGYVFWKMMYQTPLTNYWLR